MIMRWNKCEITGSTTIRWMTMVIGILWVPCSITARWNEIPMEGTIEGWRCVYTVDDDGECLIAGANNGLYQSDAGRTTWKRLDSTVINMRIRSLAVADSVYLTASDDLGLFRSTDRGVTWTSEDPFVDIPTYASESIWSLDVINGVFYAGTCRYGLYRSADNGETWDKVYEDMSCVDRIVSCGGNLIACSSDSLFLSNDNGLHWQSLKTDLPETEIQDCAAKGDTLYVGLLDEVYATTDMGEHWTAMNTGLPQGEWEHIQTLALLENTLFALINDVGIYTTSLRNVNWKPEDDTLFFWDRDDELWVKQYYDKNDFLRLIPVNDSLLIGGSCYMLQKTLTGEQSAVYTEPAMCRSDRYQCRLKCRTRSIMDIQLQMSRSTEVKIYLSDMRGALTGKMYRKNIPAGDHSIRISLHGIPSGCYIASVEIAGERFSKNMYVMNGSQ